MTITDLVTVPFYVTTLVSENDERGSHTSFEDHYAIGTTSARDDPTTEDLVTMPPASWKWEFSMTMWNILQLICSCVGILGNLLVVLVTTTRQANTNPTDILFTSLAVADLLSSLWYIPIPVAVQTPDTILGNVYCKLLHIFYFRMVCVLASTYTLVIISFERLVAVVYPLHFKAVFTKRRTYISVLASWVGALLLSSPLLMHQSNGTACMLTLAPSRLQKALNLSLLLLRMVIPVLLMVVSQIIVAVSLHRQSKRFGEMSSEQRKLTMTASRNRVVKMTFIMVAIFVLSWGTIQLTTLGIAVGFIPRGVIDREPFRLQLPGVVNSLANPITYVVYYPTFRQAVAQMFRRVKETKVPLFGVQEKRGTPAIA